MAGNRSHVNGATPVRPQETRKIGSSIEREMCDVDEEDERLPGYKATEHEWKHEMDEGKPDHGEEEEEGLVPKIKKIVAKPTPEEVERHMASHIPFRE